MQNLTYRNINVAFTFENVRDCLHKFWMDEIIGLNRKVWLTVIIKNEKGCFTLISNLPFSQYTDLIIVLKQNLTSSMLYAEKGNIKDLVLEYHVENSLKEIKKDNKNKIIILLLVYIILILLLVILLFILFIIYLNLDFLLNYDIITKEILGNSDSLKEQSVNLTTSRFRGEHFVKMFYKTSTPNSYFPSCFMPSNIKVDPKDFNLLEFIIYNQYTILDDHVMRSNEYIEGMTKILKQYQSITERINIDTCK